MWERAIDKATGEDSEDHNFTQTQFLRLFAQISLFEMEAGFSPSALPTLRVSESLSGALSWALRGGASRPGLHPSDAGYDARACLQTLPTSPDKHWVRARRWGSQVRGLLTSPAASADQRQPSAPRSLSQLQPPRLSKALDRLALFAFWTCTYFYWQNWN